MSKLGLTKKDLDMFIKDGMCTWSEDEDCVWMTNCHESHIFFDGTPIENGYRYCPYCGRPLKEVEFEYEEEEDV